MSRLSRVFGGAGRVFGKAYGIGRRLHEETGKSALLMTLDMFLCRVRYHTNIEEYQVFRFYERNHYGRSQFFGWHDTRRVEKELNDYSYRGLLDNKKSFMEAFSDFIGRRWLYAPDHTNEEIVAFVAELGEAFFKPVDAMQGRGAFKSSFEEIGDADVFCEKMRDGQYMIEEVIAQHPVLARINPNSVNTLRITTLLQPDGDVRAVSAALRCSAGESVVDNKSAGGIVTGVDVATGILRADSSTRDGRTFMRHPHTGVVLPGIELPLWDAVLDLVYRAAKALPQMRLVGWDVAITEAGPLLVEGNTQSGTRIMQHGDIGVKKIIFGDGKKNGKKMP